MFGTSLRKSSSSFVSFSLKGSVALLSLESFSPCKLTLWIPCLAQKSIWGLKTFSCLFIINAFSIIITPHTGNPWQRFWTNHVYTAHALSKSSFAACFIVFRFLALLSFTKELLNDVKEGDDLQISEMFDFPILYSRLILLLVDPFSRRSQMVILSSIDKTVHLCLVIILSF